MRRTLTASLVLLAIVLGWVAPRVLTYVCAMDGRVRTECCCAPHGDEASEAEHAAFERVGCCEIRSERGVVATSLAPDPDRAPIAAPAALQLTRSSSAVAEPWSLRFASASRGPPCAVGPPLYLRLRVLLI